MGMIARSIIEIEKGRLLKPAFLLGQTRSQTNL